MQLTNNAADDIFIFIFFIVCQADYSHGISRFVQADDSHETSVKICLNNRISAAINFAWRL